MKRRIVTRTALAGAALTVAEKAASGEWITHAWIKQAILLFFALSKSEVLEAGALEFFDKIPPKRGLAKAGVR